MPNNHSFFTGNYRRATVLSALKMVAAALMLTIAVVSCSDTTSNPPTTGNNRTSEPDTSAVGEGKFLFEMTYVNYAWGYRLRGSYIDNHGNIYSYEYPRGASPWTAANDDSLTEAELRAKYDSSATLTGKIDLSELRRMYVLIPHAAQGTLTDPVHVCSDFGGLSYLAYVYSPETQTYKRVLLYTAGDLARKNMSDEADRLYRALKQAFGVSGPEPCAYPE
jgi:hypothetical protein